jgi:signal transduction histidine kinase
LFSEFELRPVPLDEPAAKSIPRLATLPVELVIDAHQFLSNVALEPAMPLQGRTISGLRLSLVVAWIGLVAGLIAIGLLLGGVIRLSERRNDFVSAVTHELRTPLTTFRMYAEMLAEGMVPSQEQQRDYAQTMKTEADRLGHLVENVLQFARLEHKSRARTTTRISVSRLVDRCQMRLEERAAQAGLLLRIRYDDGASEALLQTVPESIEQILFNLVENACKYARPASEAAIDLDVRRSGSWVAFRVRDYGPGISLAKRKEMFRPFTKSDQDAANSAPGVGLGLALCQRMARDLGGSLTIDPHHTGPGVTFLLRLPMVEQLSPIAPSQKF